MEQSKKKKGLTKENLAIIGALDEFYDAYERTSELFISEYEKDVKDKENKHIPSPWTIESRIRKQVRKIHEPLLQNYSFLFVDAPKTIHATAESFNHFSLLEENPKKPLSLRIISFSSYLHELQFIVSFALYRRAQKENENKIVFFESFLEETNEHVLSTIESEIESQRQVNAKKVTPNDEFLYVFDRLSSTKCFLKEHRLFRKVFFVKRIDGTGLQALPTHFCEQCEKYMIGRITLNLYNNQFGKLLVRVKNENEDGAFDNFSLESQLHQLGYNVINGQLTEKERHHLLITILEDHKLSYAEICSTIEQNISRFEGVERFQFAVIKWKKDLKFLGDYVVEQEGY